MVIVGFILYCNGNNFYNFYELPKHAKVVAVTNSYSPCNFSGGLSPIYATLKIVDSKREYPVFEVLVDRPIKSGDTAIANKYLLSYQLCF